MSTSQQVETWAPGLAVGQYTLIRELARGGMGEIWLARQTATAGFDRLVVLKRVIANAEEDAAAIAMFLDEARIASQLHHPNIVQVFELGQYGSSHYLAMEYLAGQTLSRLARRALETMPRIPPSFAVSVMALAAKGLGYAHRRTDLEGRALHIVHRDVSPQNLFITYEGQVKVLDFGIARAAGRMARTATGIVKGKLAYMSPEQATSKPVSPASDVFALGVVLFELVTGTRAWRDLEELDILRRLASLEPLPKASSRTEIDPDLEAIISRAVDPSPALRYADGQAFADALEAWGRQHRATDEASIEQEMQRLFAPEVQGLGEFHKLAARTPSAVSMPNLAATTMTPAPARSRALLIGLGVVVIAAGGVALSRVSGRPVDPLAEQPAIPAAGPTLAAVAPPAVVPTPAPVVAIAPTPQPSAKEPPPALKATAAPKGASGRLTLETSPWTRVYLGKRKLGDTPLIEVPLPVGTVSLHLVNEGEHVDTVVVIPIKANELTVRDLAF